MNIKLISLISAFILTVGTGIAAADAICLSCVQMDNVTAGADGNFSQSASTSQIVQDGASTQYDLAVFAQGDSATAGASAATSNSVADLQVPTGLLIF